MGSSSVLCAWCICTNNSKRFRYVQIIAQSMKRNPNFQMTRRRIRIRFHFHKMAETTKAKVTWLYLFYRSKSAPPLDPAVIRCSRKINRRHHLFIWLTVWEDHIIYIDTLETIFLHRCSSSSSYGKSTLKWFLFWDGVALFAYIAFRLNRFWSDMAEKHQRVET